MDNQKYRPDDYLTRREHLKDLSDEALKAYFWHLAEEIVNPLVDLAYHHTTPAIERSVLLRMGFSSLEAKQIVQKTIEHELRHQSEVFQTLVDNIPGGVTLFGSDERLLAHNKEFARLLQFPPELFEGNPTLERFLQFNAARGEYGPGDPQEQVRQILQILR